MYCKGSPLARLLKYPSTIVSCSPWPNCFDTLTACSFNHRSSLRAEPKSRQTGINGTSDLLIARAFANTDGCIRGIHVKECRLLPFIHQIEVKSDMSASGSFSWRGCHLVKTRGSKRFVPSSPDFVTLPPLHLATTPATFRFITVALHKALASSTKLSPTPAFFLQSSSNVVND